MRRIWMFLAVMAVLAALRTVSYASGGGGGGSVYNNDNSDFSKAQEIQGLYQKGVEATNNGDFDKAIGYFQDILNKNPNDADALNMLAHAQRKLGRIDDALENYKKALQLRPDFAEAREYLGEAYIQAALREMDMLKGEGKTGGEQLQILQAAFKDAAKGLDKPQ